MSSRLVHQSSIGPAQAQSDASDALAPSDVPSPDTSVRRSGRQQMTNTLFRDYHLYTTVAEDVDTSHC